MNLPWDVPEVQRPIGEGWNMCKIGPPILEEVKLGGSFWLAVAAYVFPSFALGYSWHLTTFARRYHELGLYREDVIIPMGLGSMIIQGLFFAWVYPKLLSTADDQWLASGLKFAALFGTVAWSFLVLPVAAKNRMTSVRNYMVLETAFTVLQFLIAGILIAAAYRGATM
jgi:hypothetical protein